jgi:hypothetical protein
MPDGSLVKSSGEKRPYFPAKEPRVGRASCRDGTKIPVIEESLTGPLVRTDEALFAGIVTEPELAAFRNRRKQQDAFYKKGRKVVGLADFRAHHAAALLHYSDPVRDRVYRGSHQYWWLVAFFDLRWSEMRADKRLRSRERKARIVDELARALPTLSGDYYECSRRALTLALKYTNKEELRRITELRSDRSGRRQKLLELRSRRRSSLRAFLNAVADYETACRKAADAPEPDAPAAPRAGLATELRTRGDSTLRASGEPSPVTIGNLAKQEGCGLVCTAILLAA